MALVLVALAAAAWIGLRGRGASDETNSRALKVPGDPKANAGVIMQNVPLHTPYVYIVAPVCVSSGSAQITGIDTVTPRGEITISDWAVQTPEHAQPPSNTPIDGIPGTAAALVGYAKDAVTSRCARQEYTQVAVTVELGSAAAATNGLRIRFRSAGADGTVFEPFTITECTGKVCPVLAYNVPPGTR